MFGDQIVVIQVVGGEAGIFTLWAEFVLEGFFEDGEAGVDGFRAGLGGDGFEGGPVGLEVVFG